MVTVRPRGAAGFFAAAASALSAVVAVTAPVHPASVRILENSLRGITLATSEALIMSGTGMPDVTTEWMDFVSHNFIEPTVGDGYVDTPVVTPEQFWPFTGLRSMSLDKSTEIGWGILDDRVDALIAANRAAGTPDDPIAVFGYSQSAWLAAVEKQSLLQGAAARPDVPPTSFVMLADPIRPNGGLFSRWFGYGLVKWTPVISEPTGTPFPSYDIARQYDFFADFPAYPLNLLADVNAVFGLRNHDYGSVTLNPADPAYDPNTVVQQYGDTTYFLIPSALPILYPLRRLGLDRIADALDPVLRVFVELGYDRAAPFGQYTTFKLFPHVDRSALRSDLQTAFRQSVATLNPVAAQAEPRPVASVPVAAPTAPQEPAALSAPGTGRSAEPVVPNLGADAADAPIPARTARDSARSPNAGNDERADAHDSAQGRPDRKEARVSRAGST